MKKIYLLIALIITLFSVYPAESGSAGDEHVLEYLIAEALQNNPEIMAYSRKVEAFAQRPSQVTSLDDPMLGITMANLPLDTLRFDQEAMTQKLISVKQKIPFPGKLGLKGDIAEQDLAIAGQEYDEAKNRIKANVKSAYYDLTFVTRALEITKRNRLLLAESLPAAETQYAVSEATQLDVVKAHIQLSGILRKQILLDQKKETADARINNLLGRHAREAIAIGDFVPTAMTHSQEELTQAAESSRPALKALNLKAVKAGLLHSLAEKEYYPDFDIGVSYGQRDDSGAVNRPDFFSAGVSINIPLWHRNKEGRKVAEEKAGIDAALQQYEAMRNDLIFQIARLSAEIRQLEREAELFKTGLIPQSSISYETILSDYKLSKAGFLAIIKSQIERSDYELEHYRLQVDREKKLAELEAVVGQKLY